MQPTNTKAQEATLFIGNLAFEATENDLVEAFESHGQRVSLVKVSRDADGLKSRGYAFVTVLTDDVSSVIESMYGIAICGRNIRVDVSTSARSREEHSATNMTDPGDPWSAKSWTR